MFGYFDGMIRYFEVSGRSSRTQYWIFQLGVIVLTAGALFADITFAGARLNPEHLGFWTMLVSIMHLAPGVTVTVRRLHDSGHSGWWYWIALIPVIGTVWFLVLMCLGPDSDGANDYGPDPRDGRAPPERQAVRLTRTQQMVADMNARRGRRF